MFVTLLALTAGFFLAVSHPQESNDLQHAQDQTNLTNSFFHKYRSLNSSPVSLLLREITAFQNVKTGLCLDTTTDGKVFTGSCDSAVLPIWEIHDISGTSGSELKSYVNKWCLEMSLEGRVSTQGCSGSRSQQWGVSTRLWIENLRTGLCLNEYAMGESCKHEQLRMRWERRF